MKAILQKVTAENIRAFFLFLLFCSIPFSIFGDGFSIIGLYLVTIYLFVSGKEKWEKTAIVYGMGLFLIGAVCSSAYSESPLESFAYFRKFWRFGVPFLILFSFKKRKHDRYLVFLLVISSIVGIYSVGQYFTGIDLFRSEGLQSEYQRLAGVWHAVGFFSHHLTYGGVTLLLFSLFFPQVFCRQHTSRHRLLFGVGSLCNLAGVIVSMGRSVWLGAVVAIGMMVLFRLNRKRLIVLATVAILVVSAFVIFQNDIKQSSLMTSTGIGVRISSFTTEANRDRLYMWQAGINIVRDHFWLGFGPNSGERMLPYYRAIAEKEKHQYQHHPDVGVHNIYLQNWIDFGFLGLVGYLIWWLTLLVEIIIVLRNKSIRRSKENALLLGILAGLSGIMFAGFFERNFWDGEVQTTIFVAQGLALALLYKKKNRLIQSTSYTE